MTMLSPAGARNTKAYASAKAFGRSDRIPTVISKEIPFPIPRWVICSPNHIRIKEPVVRK